MLFNVWGKKIQYDITLFYCYSKVEPVLYKHINQCMIGEIWVFRYLKT